MSDLFGNSPEMLKNRGKLVYWNGEPEIVLNSLSVTHCL
jgi:hypothetical protein